MGWSCNAAAGYTMDALSQMCVNSTGSSNTWTHGRDKYFFERSNVEHDDGSITGSVFKFGDDGRCRKAGSFKINGEGQLLRFPTMGWQMRMNYTLAGRKKYIDRHHDPETGLGGRS